MTQILFVDDEPKLLEGLKRLLRPMRNEWAMTFAGGGEEALKTLEQTPFDVVVSDMRMPGMNGAELLKEVQRRYPHIVRIILSGHSDREMTFQSIGATHLFLAKPCDAEQLKATIHRACALRGALKSDALRGLVAGMRTIPSLPTLFTEIKRAVESETASLKTIGEIIAKDMGMTAKLLQLVNSAYFGLPRNVSTVEQAVSVLGLDTIQALVLSVQVFSQFQAEAAATQFQFERLWKESMRVGTLARAIAKAEQRPPSEVEQAYTAGLLHDVGVLVLATNLPDRYGAVLRKASAERSEVCEAERSELGATHAEVGASLLGLWGLNDPIVEAVAYHHRPGECLSKTFAPLTAVHVANALLQEGAEPTTGPAPVQIDHLYLEKLALADRVPRWRDMVVMLEKETAQ